VGEFFGLRFELFHIGLKMERRNCEVAELLLIGFEEVGEVAETVDD